MLCMHWLFLVVLAVCPSPLMFTALTSNSWEIKQRKEASHLLASEADAADLETSTGLHVVEL
eukprot:m.192183 g.192183  ORF g.192183 m.192183 type:complete len:62 (+) comp16764_c0_seq5:3106-3291(+)